MKNSKKFFIIPLLIILSFSAKAGREHLWGVLEGNLDKETFQLQLAGTVISEQLPDKDRTAAVLKLAKIHRLPEDVSMALIDAARLKTTPRRVKHAIFSELQPVIRDESNQMEIINWALSEKGQTAIPKVKAFIARAIEHFPYPSPQVKREIIRLALHPQTSTVLRQAALKQIQKYDFYTDLSNGNEIIFVNMESLLSSGKIADAVPAIQIAIEHIKSPSAEILLNLARLVVHPDPVFRPFRRPALNVLDRNIGSLDAEVQKELLAGLMESLVTEKTAQRILGIFSKIPQMDPSLKGEVISALNRPDKIKARRTATNRNTNPLKGLKSSLKKEWERDPVLGQALLVYGILAAGGYTIASQADSIGISLIATLSGMVFSVPVGLILLHLLRDQNCNKAFKNPDPDEGY